MGQLTAYEHHGLRVWVDKSLKGKHRDHCLCFRCASFDPANREHNCPVANELFGIDQRLGLVTPVWECPAMIAGRPQSEVLK